MSLRHEAFFIFKQIGGPLLFRHPFPRDIQQGQDDRGLDEWTMHANLFTLHRFIVSAFVQRCFGYDIGRRRMCFWKYKTNI